MTRSGVERILLLAAFIFLTVVYLFAEWRDLGRGPHVDEVEHLHATVRMARGERPFLDFEEHHPPLFWGMLRPLLPASDGIAAMQTFVTRARLFSGFMTALAILSAALILRKASGDSWTMVTFLGLSFAAGGVWRNGLADVRPDSTALGFWWVGTALVLLARRPSLRGLGLGCIFVASMIKPQWPLSSIVVGVVFLIAVVRERRTFFVASGTALAVAAAGVLATASLADLRYVYFHVITLTRAMIVVNYAAAKEFYLPYFGCPPLLRPPLISLAAAVVIAAWFRARSSFAAPRLVGTLLAIAAASLAEIYFVFPYPVVDFRYYAFWVIAAAIVLALLRQSAAALIPLHTRFLAGLRKAILVSVTILALLASFSIIEPERPKPDSYWVYMAWLNARIQPGETIWNGIGRHPIDAHDPSYYWFGMPDVLPVALKLALTEEGRRYLPPIGERDLPPCRIERGLDRNVRFIAVPMETLPAARGCFVRIRDRGLLERTPYSLIWMVRR